LGAGCYNCVVRGDVKAAESDRKLGGAWEQGYMHTVQSNVYWDRLSSPGVKQLHHLIKYS